MAAILMFQLMSISKACWKWKITPFFEYGIHTSEAQNKAIEEQLEALRLKSFRWYCQIEKEDGYAHHEKYAQDYPCRLHYRTGAKFYKIKSGKFRYYWFLGDNCASFMDENFGYAWRGYFKHARLHYTRHVL